MCRFHLSSVLVQALRAGQVCRSGPRDPTGTGHVEATKAVCGQGVSHRDRGSIRERAQNGHEKEEALALNSLKTASPVETLGVYTVILRIATIALFSTRRIAPFERYQVPSKALER